MVESMEVQTIRRIQWRIIPFLLLLFIAAYIDRANISFAALEMNKALGFDPKTYGLVSGIFFIGYLLFGVPSNLLLRRVGARRWIATIVLAWGAIVIATGFIRSAGHLYVLRFLLGLAEAGLFPGLVLYMSGWFPRRVMAKVIAMFMTAIPISLIIGAPLSTWLMDNVQSAGLAGWRWMFILEGIPAVLLGFATWRILVDSPAQAHWLSQAQRDWLTQTLEAERAALPLQAKGRAIDALRNPMVWKLSVIYILYITGSLGITYFMPMIIKALLAGSTNVRVGLISMIPPAVGIVAMNYWGYRSDRASERVKHAAVPLIPVAAAFACMGMGWLGSPQAMIGALVVVVACSAAFNGPFWAIPPQWVHGASAAVGIAFINSIGNLGGFAGPFAMGYLQTATGSVNTGLFVLAGCMTLASVLLMTLPRQIESVKAQ